MEKVLTVCPYCASGCKLYLMVEDGKVVGAEGADGYTNQGELCLKGYYGCNASQLSADWYFFAYFCGLCLITLGQLRCRLSGSTNI